MNSKKISASPHSDREIVAAVIKNDRAMIEFLFCEKCSTLLSYIAYSVFDNKVDRRELVSELFLYIAKDNWHKLRQFDFRSSLMTWMSVVATRFFQKKRDELSEKKSEEALVSQIKETVQPYSSKERTIDVRNALDKMKNARYKDVIYELDLRDTSPEEYAAKVGITVDNLYNLHRRALLQLKSIMNKKEDYYD
jgi:RNA polymerase sigma factor (sigma-70 family)